MALAPIVAVGITTIPVDAATTDVTGHTGSPVHVAIGDVITVSEPGPIVTPATVKTTNPPVPSTSDMAILQLISSSYDADGTVHAAFRAVGAGTATIGVTSASEEDCFTETTTSTTTSTASTTHTTTTTQTTSSTANASSTTTTLPHACVEAISVYGVTIVVSGSGVQSAAITVPATGSGGLPGGGVWLLVAGAGVASATLIQLHVIRARRGR